MQHLSRLVYLGSLAMIAHAGVAGAADDARELVPIPAAAAVTLQADMRDNLRALNEILGLIAADNVKEAGAVAERMLGVSAMGRHRDLPFEARPGPHMTPAMRSVAVQGHDAATAFAQTASTGDKAATLAALPSLTATCVACHFAYRIR